MIPYVFGGVVYIAGATLFVIRVPERYFVRTFDLFGASHQLFHFMVLIGCAVHFDASFKLYKHRLNMTCPIDLPGVKTFVTNK